VRIGKYPNKVKLVGKGGCVQDHFSKKTSTVTYCFYLLVEFSITFPVMYVNIKKLPKTSLYSYIMYVF